MRCSTVRTLLDDHVDGLLPADRANDVRAHLDACPECEQEMDLLRAATAPLDAWGDLDPPAGCFDRIMERIAELPPEMHAPAVPQESPSLRFLRGGARWLVTSGAAAAAVLVAAIAVERAGDVDRTHVRPSAATPAVAGVSGARPGVLKPGEIPLTRVRLAITDDLEQRDGLRRSRVGPGRNLPADLSVPVSVDPLGVGPR